VYITIKQKPSKEDIVAYGMKVNEEDAAVDYMVNYSTLDSNSQKAFREFYNISEEAIASKTKVVLSFFNEI
jgi:hypothetical protein